MICSHPRSCSLPVGNPLPAHAHFSLDNAVEQTIRRFINSDLADDLDFERMENLATERTTPGLIRSHADLLWKIHFRGSARYLILLIEFQSKTYRYMPVRILYYVAIAYHSLVAARARRRKTVPGGLLPPSLAVTIYNGRERWTAPDEVLELIEPTRGWLASRQPSLRHEILDLRGLAAQGQTEGSVVSWLASMELDSSAANITRVVREVLAEYPGPEHARLREAFREWILGAAETWGIEEEVLERVGSLKEAGMIYAGVEELKERARREGRTALVCRLARLKFGAGTADRLSRLLEEVSDPEQIARIGDRIIECETGEELLARAREA